MKRGISIIAVIGVATLAACSSKTDANGKNFAAAMSQHFDKKGDLCLDILSWPVELSEAEWRWQEALPAGRVNQMAALEAAGLVKGEYTEVDIMGFTGNPVGGKTKVKRYTLTKAAKPFVRKREVTIIRFDGKTTEIQSDLCWGKKVLGKVLKWEGPIKLDSYDEASIAYTYKVKSVANWALRPDVQSAFPFVRSVLEGAGKKETKHTLRLTSKGWEATVLD